MMGVPLLARPGTRLATIRRAHSHPVALGQVLKIMATDPGSVKDFQAFARQTGNDLLSSDAADKEFTFFMKKK